MYELLMLISNPDVDRLEVYAKAVKAEYASHTGGQMPRIRLIEDNRVLEISIGGFSFYVLYSCADEVLLESKEIAQRFASSHPQRKAIEASRCRFELNSSGSDSDMNYFNDMLFLSHAANSLGGVHVFDPGIEEFYDEEPNKPFQRTRSKQRASER